MCRECRPTSEGVETTAYTLHFQIAINGGRRACSVNVQAANIYEATTFFRKNWPMIEAMARDDLAGTPGDVRTIKLAMP